MIKDRAESHDEYQEEKYLNTNSIVARLVKKLILNRVASCLKGVCGKFCLVTYFS